MFQLVKYELSRGAHLSDAAMAEASAAMSAMTTDGWSPEYQHVVIDNGNWLVVVWWKPRVA